MKKRNANSHILSETNKKYSYQTWMTVVYDKELKVIQIINPQHCMLLQLNEEVLLGSSVNELEELTDGPNRQSAAIIAKSIRKAYEEDRNVYFEYATTHRDNTVTYAVCYAEKGLDGLLYINVIKIDEENIFEAREGFTNYVIDITINNISVGVGMRHIDEDGNKKYILFNDVAKEFFECNDVLKSRYWNQEEDDLADEKTMQLHDPLKMEKVIRDEKGTIHRWLILTKKRISSRAKGFYIITTIIDITQRRQNEILLEQQFALLDSMYKNLPVGIAIYDKKGYLLSLNQKEMEIFGIKNKETALGANLFDEPNIPEWFKNELRSAHDVEFELEYDFALTAGTRFETLNRGKKILSIKAAVIRNKKGLPDGYLQICEDITEKKKVERQLEQKHKLINTIYNTIPIGIEVYDADGCLIELNDYDMQMMGISDKKSIIGSCFSSDPNIPHDAMQRMCNGENVEYMLEYDFDLAKAQYCNTSISGKKPLNIKAAIMRNEKEKIIGYLFIYQDQTNKVRRERLLEETATKLSTFFNTMASGIEIYDKDGRLTDCNLYDLNLFGVEQKKDFINSGITLFDNPNFSIQDRERLSQGDSINMHTLYSFDVVKEQKCYHTTKTGYIHLDLKISPIISSSTTELMGYVVVMNDISYIKQREYELEETQRNLALALNAGKVSAWSYDIKNRLFTTILGYSLVGEELTYDENEKSLHPDDHKKLRQLFNDLSSGKQHKGNIILRYYEASYEDFRYYESEMDARKDEKGEIAFIFGTKRDITERCMKQLELDNARKSLDMVMEASNVLAWDYDILTRKYRLLYGNRLLEKHSGITADRGNLHPDDRSAYENLILKVVKGEIEQGVIDVRIKDEDGIYNYFEQTVSGVRNMDDKIVGLIGSMFDVTERRKQRLRLEKSREDLNLALEAGNVAAWIYDVEKKMFFTLQGDALAGDGMTLKENQKIIHPDDVQMQMDVLNSVIERKVEHAEAIFRYKTNDIKNKYHYYESKMNGKQENGKVVLITGTQKDITDTYIHQMELEEYRLKTNLINRACNIVQWDYDPERRILNTYSLEAILPNTNIAPETYFTFVHPDDVEKTKDLFAKVDKTELDIINFEIRLKIPGGMDYKRVVLDGVAIKDKEGKTLKYTGIRRDISEWMELNEQLIEKNIVNSLILNNINSGLIYMTSDCIIRWSNLDKFNHMVNSMGISSYKIGHCCPDNQRYIVEESIKEKDIRTKQHAYSEDLIVDATSIPVFNDNKLIGVLLKLDDITEQQKLYHDLNKVKEDALLSNQILEEILYRIPSAMYIKDASNGFQYIKANKIFCNTTSKMESEVIGHTDFDVFEKSSAELYRTYDLRLVGGEKFVSYESGIVVDGQKAYWQINKSIIQTADNRTFIIGISTDITNLHNFNIELKTAREKAEQSDKLKSAFLANMSHEIRTPLNAIVGFSDMLIETEDPQEKAEYGKQIRTNNELLLRLISDILDLSKIEAGIIDFKRERMDISSFFNELTSSLKQRLTNPAVEFIVENPYLSCYATYDKNRMAQVLTNFVTNAIKYTPSGFIKVGYKYENNGIKIYVIDTGIGISDNKKAKVFQRFEKLDEFAQGTGLGLSISKAITEAYGGKIGFESQEGKGSTFWAWKPCTDIDILTNSVHDEKNNQLVSVGENKSVTQKILVAEDNDSNFLLIKSILKNRLLTRAHNGVEAVKLASQHKYDAILMDIRMPQMDGLDATKEIRKFDRDIFIIAVTANAFDSDRIEALKAGCNALVTKPLKKEELDEILERNDTVKVKDAQ